MGLDGLTLRAWLARLDVKAPAIYWHFKNKKDLLDEMATQVFREALQEAPVFEAGQSWQDWALSLLRGSATNAAPLPRGRQDVQRHLSH